MRYAVIRAIHSPTVGGIRTARLVIADVPDKTTVAEVAEALERKGRAAEFSEGGVQFGNHEIRAETRAGWPKGVAGIEGADMVTWAELTRVPMPNEGRRITLRLTPAEHARYSMAAQRAGQTLQAWCLAALDRQAGESDQGEPSPAPPAPPEQPAQPARAPRKADGRGTRTRRLQAAAEAS